MVQAIGQLIGQIIGAAIGALIGALIVQLACKMVVKFKPPYGIAYKATFLGYVASVLVGFVGGFVIGASGQQFTGTSIILLMAIGFFVQAAIYAHLIKHPETGAISFGKACIVSLIQLIFGALLIGGIVLVVMTVTSI
ncbi:MAG: hypothetical protein GF353_01010 [Candidatus Lokiarchaeota archaeon]|nr:hypothetical protein [Candidatus Lokiarchaeota archaeon]